MQCQKKPLWVGNLVLKRYHEAGVTGVRPHRFKEPRVRRRIIGFDANALYLSTILRDMPCWKERVLQYRNPAGAAPMLTERLNAGTWFGFAEVDIEIPKAL